MIHYIDLFAGAGGLSEGFSQMGFNPIAHVEMNQDACMTLKTRACYYYLKQKRKRSIYKSYLKNEISRDQLYNSVPLQVLDSVIHKTMSKDNMPSIYSKIDELMSINNIHNVDLVIGGPPCQAYSLVGRAVKDNNMIGDPRNYLYILYADILKKYKPKAFVFENVPGLLNANKGIYFQDMQLLFSKIGYTIDYRILNSKDFGVLQSRKRVIIIGWLKKLNMVYPTFKETNNNYHVSDILEDLSPLQAGETCNKYFTSNYSRYLKKTGIRKEDDILTWHITRPHLDRDREIYKLVIEAWNNGKKRLKYTDLPDSICTHKNKTAFLDRFKVVAGDLPTCHTMMAHIAKDGHYFIHPDITQARSISVREAARIQSFPDDFYFEGSRTAAFTQIGNAVPPLMAKGIAAELAKQLEVQ